MRTLTPVEWQKARTELDLIIAMKKEADARHAYTKTAEFQVEKNQIEQLAYALITSSILKSLDVQVTELFDSLEVDGNGTPVDQKLAEVIELFDGNRRHHRP